MRLDYNVLWIDDEISSLSRYKTELISINEEVGIETKFYNVSAKPGAREIEASKLVERIQNEITNVFDVGSIDLILVDLHLGALSGHEIIEFIRDTQTMYRPIIFYSGGFPKGEARAVGQLQDAIRDNGLLGKCIFLSSREQLSSDLRKICREMQAEEQKVKPSRGLLMERTSEVDALVLNYLKKKEAWDKLTTDQINAFFKKVKKRLGDKAKTSDGVSKLFENLAQKDFVTLKNCFLDPDQQKNLRAMDSSVRNYILKELLCAQPDLKNHGDTHVGYFNDKKNQKSISKFRNEYAHQTVAELEGSHDPDRCKLIRSELRKHLRNVRAVTTLQ